MPDMFCPKHTESLSNSPRLHPTFSLFYFLFVSVSLSGSFSPHNTHKQHTVTLGEGHICTKRGRKIHVHTQVKGRLSVSQACWKWSSSGQTSLLNPDSYSTEQLVSLDSHLNLKYHTACYFRSPLSSLASVSNETSIIHWGFWYNFRCTTMTCWLNIKICMNIKQLQIGLLFSCLINFPLFHRLQF